MGYKSTLELKFGLFDGSRVSRLMAQLSGYFSIFCFDANLCEIHYPCKIQDIASMVLRLYVCPCVRVSVCPP